MEKSTGKSLYRKKFRGKAVEIGARHKKFRVDLGLTIVQLAKQFEIGKTTISNCERGIQEFPLSYLVEFANEFGINIPYLVEGQKWPKYVDDAIKRPVMKVSDRRKKAYADEEENKFEEVLKALQDDSDLLETIWHLIKAKQGMKKYHSRE